MGPRTCGSVTAHRARVTHMIYLENQTNSGGRRVQTQPISNRLLLLIFPVDMTASYKVLLR